MQTFMRNVWKIIRYLTLRLLTEGYTYRAASLAYTTVLAIVPLMIAIFTILAYVPFYYDVAKQLQAFLIRNFVVSSAASSILQHLTAFIANVHRLSSLNIIFLIVLDVLMLYNIHRAFNAIWHAKPRWHLSFSFLVYFVVLMLSPLVFGGMLILGSFFFKLPWVED